MNNKRTGIYNGRYYMNNWRCFCGYGNYSRIKGCTPRSKIGTAESERRRESQEGIYTERDRGRYKQRGREQGEEGV